MAQASQHASSATDPRGLQLRGNGTPRVLTCRVLQSPLAGVSDRIFRQLVRRWASEALLFTEMVNATSLELGHGTQKVDELADEAGPIGVQLFDHRPAAMADAVQVPVTVKTRLGWCDGSDAIGWCRRLEAAGAQLLTLHGRTREQGFKGRADWDAIAAVKGALGIPVIANGDIQTPADALACLKVTGADGVMVGRGTMGAPWLVGQLAAALAGQPVPATPGPAERLALAAEQLQALVAARGDHGLLIARKHMGWLCTGFAGAPQLRHNLMRAPTPAAALALLAEASAGLGQGSTAGQPWRISSSEK